LISDNGKVRVITRKHNLSKVNLKHRINKYKKAVINSKLNGSTMPNHINYDLPLPVNKVSKIIGSYRAPGGNKKIFESNNVYDKNLLVQRLLMEVDKEYIDSRLSEPMFVCPGSHRYNSKNLRIMATPCDKEYSVDELLDGYFSRVGIDLILPKFNKFSPESILGVEVNGNSKPGILSSKLVGTKRRDTIKYSKPIAYEYCKKIMDENNEIYVDRSLYNLGGREKRVKSNFNTRKDLTTRTIFMQEDVPTLIGQSVCKYLQHAFQTIGKGHNYGGRINGRQNFKIFRDDMQCSSYHEVNCNFDFSQHDNRTTELKSICGIAILRLCFPEDEKYDRLFYYLASSSIFKRVVLPESNLIYEISKGLASGHGLTSILTTIIAFGTVATGINNVLTKKNYDEDNTINVNDILTNSVIRNAGDDLALKIDGRIIDSLSRDIIDNSGMEIDDLNNHVGYFNSFNRNLRCTFLKKKYTDNNFSWNDWEFFDNILHPVVRETFRSRIIDSLYQIVESSPYDRKLNAIVMLLACCVRLEQLSYSDVYMRARDGPMVKNDNSMCAISTTESINLLNHVLSYDGAFEYDIDAKILSYDYKTSYSTYHSSVDMYACDTKRIIQREINYINRIISRKCTLLMFLQPFKKHSSTHRLKVFDMAKVYVHGINIDDNVRHDLIAEL
jgi:hypothetical protein